MRNVNKDGTKKVVTENGGGKISFFLFSDIVLFIGKKKKIGFAENQGRNS